MQTNYIISKWITKMNKNLVIVLVAFAVTACTGKENKLEKALREAKNNRSELLNVLDHYKNDSLKLKAAEFLIENMPGRVAYHYKYIDSIQELKKNG